MLKRAYVFPGQGSQSVGMLSDIAQAYPEIEHIFNQASNILGYDTWQLASAGPAEQLNKTEFTQPLILIASVALWGIIKKAQFPTPVLMAGHSLGEYSALVCAQSISFEEGIRLVAQRGRFMQNAVAAGQGAMAAILGADDEAVRRLCEETRIDNEVLAAVNYNAPGQVVIAGDAMAVERAIAVAKDFGAKRALALPVSVPSHCQLMQPAATQLAETVEKIPIKIPTVPVLHNVNVKSSETVEEMRQALIAQLYSPVRWVETIETMAAQGVQEIIEVGPGTVLSGLIKRIDSSIVVKTTNTLTALQEIISFQGVEL